VFSAFVRFCVEVVGMTLHESLLIHKVAINSRMMVMISVLHLYSMGSTQDSSAAYGAGWPLSGNSEITCHFPDNSRVHGVAHLQCP